MTRYAQLQREHQISPGDFPDIKKMQEQLANQDFTKFHPLDKKLLERVDKMLAEDIAKLMVSIVFHSSKIFTLFFRLWCLWRRR